MSDTKVVKDENQKPAETKPVVNQPVEKQPTENAKEAVERKSLDSSPTPEEAVKGVDLKHVPEKQGTGTKFFRSAQYAGLVVLVDGEQKARFTPHFDTFKGDKVLVGYLATNDKDVIKRLDGMSEVEEVSQKDYEKDTSELDLAPVYSV